MDWHIQFRRLQRENAALREELERTRTDLKIEQVYADAYAREAVRSARVRDDEAGEEK